MIGNHIILTISLLAALAAGHATVSAAPNPVAPEVQLTDTGKQLEATTDGKFNCIEVPKHEVTLTKGFYLGKYEVTQAQYQAIAGANPSKSTKEPNCPLTQSPKGARRNSAPNSRQKPGRPCGCLRRPSGNTPAAQT